MAVLWQLGVEFIQGYFVQRARESVTIWTGCEARTSALPRTSDSPPSPAARQALRRAARARRGSPSSSAYLSVMCARRSGSTQALVRRDDRHRGQILLASSRPSCDDRPNILLPLPRGSSGSSCDREHEHLPSRAHAQQQRFRRPPAPAPARVRLRPPAPCSTVLPARLRECSSLELHDEAVAGVATRAPSGPRARRSARRANVAPSGGSRRPDSGSPCPRADGSVCASRLYARPVLSRNTASCLLRPRAAARNSSPGLVRQRRADRSRDPSPRAPSRARDSTTVTGSLATSSDLVDRLRRLALDDAACGGRRRTSSASATQLFAHQLASAAPCDLSVFSSSSRSAASSVLLAADLHLLELREVAQLGLEDRLGLQRRSA